MNAANPFTIAAREGRARTGLLATRSGTIETPAFMPVATQGSVKGVSPAQLKDLGASILLSNTYHLHLRPGDELIRDLGGIHRFMGWDGPILTDSGGYQIFSLSKLRTITAKSAVFQSHLDGSTIELTPEKVVRIQENLGVDIMMVLDECLEAGAGYEAAEASLSLTLDWARRSRAARVRDDILMFGIVQGGTHEGLRVKACEELIKIGFEGYAIGGVSVGESTALMRAATDLGTRNLPEDRIRYLMGVGTPLDIVQSVALGIDLFDCVIPTRSARFGRLYVEDGYINIRNTRFRSLDAPLCNSCDCYACKNFSAAYISHLIHAKEMLGVQLATLHNLRFYQRLMGKIRAHILSGSFLQFSDEMTARWSNQATSRE